MKIIIIGAGIAGLTTAYACQRAGFEVKCYDKAKKLRHIGGGILIWPYGLRFLDWLDLYQHLEPYGVDIKGCSIVNDKGDTVFKEDYADLYQLLGGEILPIDRSLLQQTLLAQLNPNNLQLNKNCIAIEQDETSAYAVFSDGTKEQADIIIGADGLHSIVREKFSDVSPVSTDYYWWGGVIEQKSVPHLPRDQVLIATGPRKLCMVWPAADDLFMWYLPVKLKPGEKIDNADLYLQSLCIDWNKDIQAIVNAPQCRQTFNLPIYTLPPQSIWSHQRTTVVGDAAHGLGPILGQGASQGIEDAFVLTHCLKYSSDIPAALTRYEKIRRLRAERLYELENQAASMMIQESQDGLAMFEEHIKHINLATMYQDIIPMVNEDACLTIASCVLFAEEMA